MLINSVVLVLQETLEAALLISVLLAVSYQQSQKITWLAYGLSGGLLCAVVYAINMAHISEWFDYVGQEVMNALLQILTALFISLYSWNLFSDRKAAGHTGKAKFLATFYAISIVTLVIAREGSEILLYLEGVFQQDGNLQTVSIGSSIGFAIGISIGILLLYGLAGLPKRSGLRAAVVLVALFAGNMLSQAVLQLTQADWISSTQAFWDTSDWLSENSIAGQLLYAFIGYEATPSFVQVISYVTGVILVLATSLSAKTWAKTGADTNRPGVAPEYHQ